VRQFVWENGTPELCVEILTESDTRERLPLAEKLRRFHITEVARLRAELSNRGG
jgi:hypothetical protein